MNAIAAHKNELEPLLVNLSRDTAVSGMDFAAALNVYIARLDTNCSDISERCVVVAAPFGRRHPDLSGLQFGGRRPPLQRGALRQRTVQHRGWRLE